jgi:creatinine amidohydrolase/Fe(II)-dependent formamide hydrolase-like protein
MRLAKLREVLAACPLAIQPTGLLEWHGGHNPLGMDGLNATYICERVIAKLGAGVLMPTCWTGTYGYATYPGSIVYEQDTTEAVLFQTYRELVKVGFRVVLVLMGHWGICQQDALHRAREAAANEAKEAGLDVRLLGHRWCDFITDMERLTSEYGGHGQEGETSVAWRIGEVIGIPLVDLAGYRPGTETIPLYPVGKRKMPREKGSTWKWKEEVADASKCGPGVGEEVLSAVIENIIGEVKETLSEIGVSLP